MFIITAKLYISFNELRYLPLMGFWVVGLTGTGSENNTRNIFSSVVLLYQRYKTMRIQEK